MQHILILGAGLSASSLIKYLLDYSEEFNWHIRLGDLSVETADAKINHHPRGEAFYFNVNDDKQCADEVQKADIVVSMLPASLHYRVARACVDLSKNMVTASYVSPQIEALQEEAKAKGVLILNEIGVDPGIDHMSAMQIIDRIKVEGGNILSFQSSTGGLVAPKYDNNPWNYKFTWNPRNVVIAGQGVSTFIRNGNYKYIPYHKLFRRILRTEVLDFGEFEIYPNRDSLKYREIYGLDNIPSMFRGTMRRPGFSRSWDIFVQLGMTDDTFVLEDSENMTYREFVNSFLRYETKITVETKLAKYLGIDEDSEIMYKLRWLDLFKPIKIGLKRATPAQILQHILLKKWVLEKDDKDMIVMQHRFEVALGDEKKTIVSSMAVEGTDQTHTAMSKTVGYPVAIACKLILTGQIKDAGVKLPLDESIYKPILKELADFGIRFIEEEIEN
ncbi:MAG: saccharopine dehydrogenase NADP-binding domain-containing protein [Bacteroidales bacterium]|jgi:saccharopine dehydrogenase-like NADP-dependent oxidoreductase|nr:saccharopine dehydrogenase NADP-binding domain-containing protein [Bacteroidales bacterium]